MLSKYSSSAANAASDSKATHAINALIMCFSTVRQTLRSLERRPRHFQKESQNFAREIGFSRQSGSPVRESMRAKGSIHLSFLALLCAVLAAPCVPAAEFSGYATLNWLPVITTGRHNLPGFSNCTAFSEAFARNGNFLYTR